MKPLTITARDAATGPVLEITGDLDHESADLLRGSVERLALAPGRLLVLDLGGLDFCDSSGITVLLAARHTATVAGAGIALAAVPANMRRVLSIIGLDRVFVCHPDTATATATAAATTPASGRGAAGAGS
ncbi:STAS domain-containing protein [Streptomyces sp. NPDC001985]|uniref:STAS domain-containing protein n=1 Tax=Streptomyces sp. NPDC001985 TaxID=3154406 RepID=UPI0033256FBB